MLTVLDIIKALELDVYDSYEELHEPVRFLSIDTRTLQKGDVFVALKGENTNGHMYIEEAISKGASVIIIEDSRFIKHCQKATYFLVEDSVKALNVLGKMYREKSIDSLKAIAITGSIGKTTLKNFLTSLLSKIGETVSSPKNYNNHLGVPLSLSCIQSQTKYGVFEVGMNNPGEISPLAKMIQPNIAVVTYIGDAHLGNMGSVENIAHEKAEIFSGLKKDGIAFLPYDTPFKNILIQKAKQHTDHIVTVGYDHGADIYLKEYKFDHNGLNCAASIFGDAYHFTMPVYAEHFSLLALFALGICVKIGIPVQDVLPYVSELSPVSGRGKVEVLTLQNGKTITVIDDSYNASFSSMKAGLSVLDKIKGLKKIAVLGEIGELYDFAQKIHEDIGVHLNQLKIDHVFLVGDNMKYALDRLSLKQQCTFSKIVDDCFAELMSIVEDGDVILLKGSNSNKLWKVIDYFVQKKQA